MRLAITLLLAAIPLVSFAQAFQAEDDAFVWRQGDQYIRFAKGVWSAGIDNAPGVRWHMFQWHDDWKYETMQGGTVDNGPALDEEGNLVLSGTFSARNESAPIRYTCTMTPGPEGVKVICDLRKTGDLKLTSGVLLHVFAEKGEAEDDRRIWLRPSWHGPLGASASGAADRMLIELDGRRSLALTQSKYRPVTNNGPEGPYGFRFPLSPRDFPTDETVHAEFMISFDTMPDSFPGEVKPMAQPLALNSATANSTTVPQYGKLELTVDLAATYENPYDPDDVALDAVFTSPSGKTITMPGFFMVEQARGIQDNTEVLTPVGSGVWRVRFSPLETGKYTWELKLRDRTGEVKGCAGEFESVAAGGKGFIRVSKVDPHYFAFDNGEGYLAIGHNLPIYHTSGELADEGMRKFAAAKENWNRWWMASYGFGIEWESKLGWYRQDNAARIDFSLDWARELGLYYMMCMDTHQDFRASGWDKNPFNAKNGGPCETAGDWFTDETAREYYRKRLRYTIARWGFSPHVACWEFGNEFEGWADSPNAIKLPWHREMSDYLTSIDPYDHLISTSFWGHTGPEEFWELPNIDFVQTHCYSNDDENVAIRVREYSQHQWTRFDKPHVFGEFGIRSHSSTADKDPEGWGIHNSLWSGLANFCAGPPMPWWHENYIDPLDLYFHFTALANFTEDLPFGTAKWEPLEFDAPEYVDKDREPEIRDAVITPMSRWGKPATNEFVVLPDGTVADERRPQELLQGLGHEDIKNPPTFIVDYPADGQFTIGVGTVSNSGLLRVWVDGEQKLEVDLPCGEGLEKGSTWREQWKLWETVYNKDFAVDIPAGRHEIRVENFGKDWVRVKRYRFTGCLLLDKPNLLVCGMRTDNVALLWVQNRDSSWYNHAGNGAVGSVDASTIGLRGLPDGDYRVEWWDTWKGSVQRTEEATVSDGELTLALPRLETDLAMKLRTPVERLE